MRHEIFNSILGAVGLVIAAVTAWHQFAPAADRIQLTIEHRIDTGIRLEIQPSGLDPLYDGIPMSTVGPLTWKIRVYNPSDQPVSIVSFSIFLLLNNNQRIQYSAIRSQLSPYDASISEQILPDNIDAKEAKAYFLSLHMPFASDQDIKSNCEDKIEYLHDLEYCFYSKGRDLFGNTISRTVYGDALVGSYSVTWDPKAVAPRFVVIFETADGSQFESRLSYFSFD